MNDELKLKHNENKIKMNEIKVYFFTLVWSLQLETFFIHLQKR
jgi:hypothetical protein